MLKGIHPLLNAELLHVLAAMGHGDELALVDANFPAASVAKKLIRLDGVDTPTAMKAILTLFPLDTFVPSPVAVMQVVGDPNAVPPPVRDFQPIVDEAMGKPVKLDALERFAFYERARKAFAIVATGEQRGYGNAILTKGVIAIFS
jgi:L-fucose mutarotase